MHNEYESALIHAIEVIHELMEENKVLTEKSLQMQDALLDTQRRANGERPNSAGCAVPHATRNPDSCEEAHQK